MRLLSPRGSQITTTTVAGADDVVALQWEYDDERGRMYVTMPDDQ
jgi:hypothetical protein